MPADPRRTAWLATFARLAAAWPGWAPLTEEDLDARVAVWSDILDDLSPEDIERGSRKLVREAGKEWPTPAGLLRAAGKGPPVTHRVAIHATDCHDRRIVGTNGYAIEGFATIELPAGEPPPEHFTARMLRVWHKDRDDDVKILEAHSSDGMERILEAHRE